MTVRHGFGHAAKANGWRYWLGLTMATARYYVRQRRWPGLVRALWHTIAFGYYGELCQVCGRPYVLWSAPDDIYAVVIGSHAGLYCPNCFDRAAGKADIELQWIPRPFMRAQRDAVGAAVGSTTEER